MCQFVVNLVSIFSKVKYAALCGTEIHIITHVRNFYIFSKIYHRMRSPGKAFEKLELPLCHDEISNLAEHNESQNHKVLELEEVSEIT